MHNCRWLTKQHTQSLTRESKERDRHRGGEREGCMACERDSTKHVKQLLNGHPAAATICTCTFVSPLCGIPSKIRWNNGTTLDCSPKNKLTYIGFIFVYHKVNDVDMLGIPLLDVKLADRKRKIEDRSSNLNSWQWNEFK